MAHNCHATTDASRLKAGQKVRIAGVPVGSAKAVKPQPRPQHRRGTPRSTAIACTRPRVR